MAGGTNNNGWTEWRKHVLLEIERINDNLEKLNEKHTAMCIEIARLKVHAAIWGAIGGGVIASVVTAAVAVALSRG